MNSSGLLESVARIEEQVRGLLAHPGTTQQDKASLVLAGVALSEIRNRRKNTGRFVPAPGLDPGWMLRRERAEEAR